MTWEELVERLEAGGHRTEELDFMENYGPIAASRHAELEGRRIRCVFGELRIDGDTRFEVYVLSSGDDAEEFLSLMKTDAWGRIGNVVFRSDPVDTHRIAGVLTRAAKEISGSPRERGRE
jgi:hypothetical protein